MPGPSNIFTPVSFVRKEESQRLCERVCISSLVLFSIDILLFMISSFSNLSEHIIRRSAWLCYSWRPFVVEWVLWSDIF